ncbi:MAG: hypothetical protein ACR2PZ_21700 [Pseudomonadales bacterium]
MFDAFEPDDALIRHLSAATALSPVAAQRCVREVLAYYDEPLEAFVVRRHQELQQDGQLKNQAIYQQIVAEAYERRFAIAALSLRQVRRMIYG